MRLIVGELIAEVLPGGRVLVTLPRASLPFGVTIASTALYPNLRAFLVTIRKGRGPALSGGCLA